MGEVQLSLFDAPAARKYERQQKHVELDAFLLKHLGPKGARRWHDKEDKLQAELDRICKTPLSLEMQEIAAKVSARVIAKTKPLCDKYALLGIEQGATKREIKNAYRRKARKMHPDVGGDAESFKQLHESYLFLLKQVRD